LLPTKGAYGFLLLVAEPPASHLSHK
jgi:hypothetical protein